MISLNIRPAAQERNEATPIRVLYAGDIELARPQFASSARQLTLVPIRDVVGAFGGRSAAADLDVALIDCSAPGVNAAQIVAQLRNLRATLPIVLLIDPGAENGAATALSLQADDYTVKTPGWLTRLPVRLQLVVNRQSPAHQGDIAGAAEQRVKAAVERAPVCLTRILEDGSVAAMNDAARGMLAVESLEDVLKKPLSTFVAPADHFPLNEFIATVCSGEARSIELSLGPNAFGARIAEFRGAALPPDADGRRSAIVAMRDLSDRRRLEASVVDISTQDSGVERAAADELRAELEEIRKRLADTEAERERLVNENVAQRQAAETAAVEMARIHAHVAATDAKRAGDGDLERALRASLQHAEETLQREQQKREVIEEQLVFEMKRYEDERQAREKESVIYATVTAECESLRIALSEQQRTSAADGEALVARIKELEHNLRAGGESSDAALNDERRAREAVESRLSEIERRSADESTASDVLRTRLATLEQEREQLAQEREQLVQEIDQRTHREEAQAQLKDMYEAQTAEARNELAAAIRECDSLRSNLDAERQRYQQAAEAAAAAASQAVLLLDKTATIERLTEQLRTAEAACQQATAERDEQAKTLLSAEADLRQSAEHRRSYRQELLAALNDVQHFEDLSARHLARCGELERELRAAKSDLNELTAWASARATRLSGIVP